MVEPISAAMQCNSVCQLVALVSVCITMCIVSKLATLVVFKVLDTVKAFKRTSVKVAPDSVNVELNRD